MGIKTRTIQYKKLDRLFLLCVQNIFVRRLIAKFKLISPFEKKLISSRCDIVYFVTPNFFSIVLQKLNYITTLWDLCHRDNPEFPEVRDFGEFYFRENNYQACLASALLVLTDSDQLTRLASQRYGVDREKFLAMPYAPSPLALMDSEQIDFEILSSYGLTSGYFLYPAQFWPHKNHIRILQALIILKSKYHWTPKVVFLGKDKGNLSYLRSYIESSGLTGQVDITGFVPSSHIGSLYRGSLAVVMPTYFGPTNLPPFEAWVFDKPLIYSSHLSEQAGDAALLVDPDSADQLSDAMCQVRDPSTRKALIVAGQTRLAQLQDQRTDAETRLADFLLRFLKRRECWE
jgi:glycosyltransferase involved in cell wall biosynthesis